jgi:glycosyltransferase involved in cell wall biosynthesis
VPSVLHIINASDAGGLSRYVIDLASRTKQAGWDVAVAGDGGVWQSRFDDAGVPYIRIPLGRGLRGFVESMWLLRRQARRFDLIHTHYRKSTILARRLQLLGHPPILYTLHLSHIDVRGWRRWVADFGDHVLAPSSDAVGWLVNEAGVDHDRISVVPHGIDLARWPVTGVSDRSAARASLGIPAEARAAVYVGRLDYPKNVAWVIEAHHAARAIMPDHHTLIVGDGPERRLFEEEPGLMLLGERDPLEALRASDLLVLASLREGFSYVCAEALATGLPILRTRTTGTRETVVEGVTGFSVDVDRSAFVHAFVERMRDITRLGHMRSDCAAFAREHLSIDRQLRWTLDLYEKVSTLARR